jgi:hypothetical protein
MNGGQPTTTEGVRAALLEHGVAPGGRAMLGAEHDAAREAIESGLYVSYRSSDQRSDVDRSTVPVAVGASLRYSFGTLCPRSAVTARELRSLQSASAGACKRSRAVLCARCAERGLTQPPALVAYAEEEGAAGV